MKKVDQISSIYLSWGVQSQADTCSEALEPSLAHSISASPGRMLVHRRSPPAIFFRFPQQFAGTHLYTWVERGIVRVKCLAQEHNTMSPARARTQTARSGVERTNHETTAPPQIPQPGLIGDPMHLVSLLDKHWRPVLDTTPLNTRLQASKFVYLQL